MDIISDNSDNNYGYVYCLTNKYMPNICKIGFTNKLGKTSHDRAKELARHTNCPVPFEVEFDIKVRNPERYERIIHRKLKTFRINPKREFFECKPQDIIKYFDKSNLINNNCDEDFPDNYLTNYNCKEIDKTDQINKIDKIDKNDNILNIKIYNSFTIFIKDIYYVFIVLFNAFISLFYYLYIFVKYMFNKFL